MADNDPNPADAADYDLVPVDHVPQFGAAAGAAKAAPNLLEQAQAQYPILQGLDYGYVENFRPNAGFLEHWQPGDAGVAPSSPASLDALRPKELPIDKPGLEIRDPTTRPIDILGDIVSHNLVNTDPVVKRAYDKLQASLTPHQQSILQNQYEYAQKNEGETGSFEDWKQRAGMPGFLRGYTFQQWPKEFTDKVYTPQQRADLDKLMEYFRTPASSDDASNFQLVPVDHQPDFGNQQGMATGGVVQDKASKAKAHYRGGSKLRHCSICTMFQPPNGCSSVRGQISPQALCDFFERVKDAKTLYVMRPLLNAGALIAWAKSQGFKKTVKPTDMHVTITFSRDKVDHNALKRDRGPLVASGGKRTVKPLGDEGAVVLTFESSELSERWREFRGAGASWDWESYQPHVTITYDGEGLDLKGVKPYMGPLRFGPEQFSELDEGWKDKIKET